MASHPRKHHVFYDLMNEIFNDKVSFVVQEHRFAINSPNNHNEMQRTTWSTFSICRGIMINIHKYAVSELFLFSVTRLYCLKLCVSIWQYSCAVIISDAVSVWAHIAIILHLLLLEDLGSTLDHYISQFPKVKLIRNKEREGLVRARMAGVYAATAEVIIIKDAHTEYEYGEYDWKF